MDHEHQYHWYCTSQDILSTTRNKCTDMPALAHKCWHTHLQCLHARTRAHTHTHTHTRTHAYTHKNTCTRTHARARTHTHMHMHTRTRACTQTSTHIRAHMHACTRGRTLAHTHTLARTHSSVLVQHFGQGDMLFYRLACVHMCVHRTTGIALYLGLNPARARQNRFSELLFCQGALCTVPCMPSKSDAGFPSARGSSGRHSG